MVSTSQYKGVTKAKPSVKYRNPKWRAVIRVNKRAIQLGSYDTEIHAAIAYNLAAIEYFGEFAKLNVIHE